MRWPWRREPTAEDAYQARWAAWWESAGRREVMRLLAEHDLPTDPYFNGPYWPEAEGIGDSARYGFDDVEDLIAMLNDFAEDLGGADSARPPDAAAEAIARYLREHAPAPEG